MPLSGRSLVNRCELNCRPQGRNRKIHVQLKKKRYASPGGGSKIDIELAIHWTNNPAIGVLNGQSLAKNDDSGRIPSRPSSWTILPWMNKETKLHPQADNAITRLSNWGPFHRTIICHWSNARTLSVPSPKRFRKKSALGSQVTSVFSHGLKRNPNPRGNSAAF